MTLSKLVFDPVDNTEHTLFTSVRIAHRRNKIVVVPKLLPSRAFPVDGRSAGPHATKMVEVVDFRYKSKHFFETNTLRIAQVPRYLVHVNCDKTYDKLKLISYWIERGRS